MWNGRSGQLFWHCAGNVHDGGVSVVIQRAPFRD